MPNWCENELTITGPKEVRDTIVKIATIEGAENLETTHELLRRLYPIPEILVKTVSPMEVVDTQEEADRLNKEHSKNCIAGEEDYIRAITHEEADKRLKTYGCLDWYNWCTKHWGTKWGDCRTYLGIHDDKKTFFAFDTAWSPPVAGFLEISKMFPSLTFKIKFWEGGMAFRGHATLKNGNVLDDDERAYKGDRGG